MPTPSIAENYFRDLQGKADLFSQLQNLVNSQPPTVETEWLDFKGGQRITESDVKFHWSRALSGFSNSQGGVLVWGLDCRKVGEPPIDQVSGVALVSNPNAFASRLTELLRQACDPPAIGVEIIVAHAASNPAAGFVICYVPESPNKPLRAEHAEKAFYMRAADNFFVPGVSVLRSLFAPTSTARFGVQLQAQLRPREVDVRLNTMVDYFLFISNRGLVSPTSLMLTPLSAPAGEYSRFSGWEQTSRAASGIAFESPRPLYPGERLQVFRFTSYEAVRERGATEPRLAADFTASFAFGIFSLNQPPFKASVTFTRADILGEATKHCEVSEMTEHDVRP